MIMDYLVIGSNGFGQVGDPEFLGKNHVELRILLQYLKDNYPIPDEFSFMCYYKVKWFSHDLGMYSEIVLIYDDYILNQWDEDDPEKFDRFWDWFNKVESADLESDSLTEVIKSKYREKKSTIT
jgi:hypothetical protein